MGIEPIKTVAAVRYLGVTLDDYAKFKRQNRAMQQPWAISMSSPCFADRDDSGGVASGHYFHQDLLVARRIFERQPEKHVDVGSRVDGFVGHVAVFREIEVIDVRPISSVVKNVHFRQDDIMDPKSKLVDYCDSLSCLHALEHFGLGRYGDALDAEGYVKGFNVLTRMLKSGGTLYLSVPIGKERIEFNGQRVFSVNRVCGLFKDLYNLRCFSYVDDSGQLHEGVADLRSGLVDDFGLDYGCGIFELEKL